MTGAMGENAEGEWYKQYVGPCNVRLGDIALTVKKASEFRPKGDEKESCVDVREESIFVQILNQLFKMLFQKSKAGLKSKYMFHGAKASSLLRSF